MKKDISDKTWLESMMEHIKMIESFILPLSYNEFLDDSKTKFACDKCIQNIAEASDNISKQMKDKYPELPWRKIKAMRNIIVHEYFQIDYSIVWDVIQNFLPELEKQIQGILDEYLL